ncbi:phosphatase and actin regulator 3 [Pteropus alecto]|uniref:phosphatase and actin regulator 3 n=1 Tax=Pteropus alecto TaxID=9402 RepID=UPI0003F121B5|nr:phosphatase and actin regulator 3 [Pteropus alecto]
MDPAPPARSEYLVSGTRTPPVRRSSKLATLGRIFKPWKWRKKKTEKLKQTTSGECRGGARSRSEALGESLLERIRQDAESKACNPDGGPRATRSNPSTPEQEALTLEEARPGSPLATGMDQDPPEKPLSSDAHSDDAAKMPSASRGEDADATGSLLPTTDESSQALAGSDALDSPPGTLERAMGQLPSPPLLPTPPPKAVPKATKNVTGESVSVGQAAGAKSADPPLRGQLTTPTGSPHLTTVHRPLPPSRVIEELHRALATKHRQDSFQGRDGRGSPRKRVDVRLSRTSSVERAWSFDGAAAKESEENKENLLSSSGPEGDLLLYQDEEALNDSVISGTLPRKCKKELLAVKLRNRPSKQELEDRNIFPRRTDEERQEIRQQIEMKLSKRLSQRPAVEELERRNILKQRNDQTEQDERREIKQRLTRKLNQRPTVDELRDRKILIRFSDYVEVAKAQDYDRRADKPWTRLSAADKAAIRKELNEYKSNEMEVHASSKHLTRSDFHLCEFGDTHSVVFIKEKCMEEVRIQVNKCSISVGNHIVRIMLLD